jgi:hypothetical protein
VTEFTIIELPDVNAVHPFCGRADPGNRNSDARTAIVVWDLTDDEFISFNLQW